MDTQNTLKYGSVFKLDDMADYEKGKAYKTSVFGNSAFQMFLLTFDDDTAMPAHKAPGNALITVLKGKAKFTYEGKEYELKEGDSFAMTKGATHSIDAKGKFKMLLTISLEA